MVGADSYREMAQSGCFTPRISALGPAIDSPNTLLCLHDPTAPWSTRRRVVDDQPTRWLFSTLAQASALSLTQRVRQARRSSRIGTCPPSACRGDSESNLVRSFQGFESPARVVANVISVAHPERNVVGESAASRGNWRGNREAVVRAALPRR